MMLAPFSTPHPSADPSCPTHTLGPHLCLHCAAPLGVGDPLCATIQILLGGFRSLAQALRDLFCTWGWRPLGWRWLGEQVPVSSTQAW